MGRKKSILMCDDPTVYHSCSFPLIPVAFATYDILKTISILCIFLIHCSDPNVKAFGFWYISNFKVLVKKIANENEIRKKLFKLNPLFFEKYELEIETCLESPNTDPENYASDLQTKTGTTDRRMVKITLSNLKKRTKEKSFTTSRIHEHEHSSAEETYPLQPQDDKLCLSDRNTDDDFVSSKEYGLDSDNYDTSFDKSENRKKYEGLSDHQVVLKKIGTDFLELNGIMWSSVFYVKGLNNERNPDSVFIVLGADGNLPYPNISISLVCLPPQRAQQDQIDCVGIIYSTPVDKIHTRETSSEMENATSEANISTDGRSSEICR